jgi:hypothetical protein
MSGIRLQLKHDSAASWASHNTVLRSGEIGYDTTNEKFVIGDNVTAWNSWTEDDFFTKSSTSPGVWGMITGTLSAQTDLQAALDAKVGTSSLQESVEDIIGSKVVAGSNVTVTYNDTTGSTTIAASSGGTVNNTVNLTGGNMVALSGYASLSAAVTAIGSTVRTPLLVDEDQNVAAATTVTANIVLVEGGGRLTKTSTGSIVFQGVGLANPTSKQAMFVSFPSGGITWTGATADLRPAAVSTELWDTGNSSLTDRLSRADGAFGAHYIKIICHPRTMTAVVTLSENRNIFFEDGDYANTTSTGAAATFLLNSNTEFHGSWNARLWESQVIYGARMISAASLLNVVENIVVRDICIQGDPLCVQDSSGATVLMGNCHFSKVENVLFRQTHAYNVCLGGYGPEYARDSEIVGCQSDEVGTQVFNILNGSDCRIAGNHATARATDNLGSLIDVEPNTYNDVVGNLIIEDNHFDVSGPLTVSYFTGVTVQCAAGVPTGQTVIVQNNTFTGRYVSDDSEGGRLASGVVLVGIHDGYISGNKTRMGRQSGISLANCRDITISENENTHCLDESGNNAVIELTSCANCIVKNNVNSESSIVPYGASTAIYESETRYQSANYSATQIIRTSRFDSGNSRIHSHFKGLSVFYNGSTYTISSVDTDDQMLTLGSSAGNTSARSFFGSDVNFTTNVITITGHGYANNRLLRYIGPVPLGGLTDGQEVFVINQTANTLQVSTTSGGSAIDLSAAAGSPDIHTFVPVVLSASMVDTATETITMTAHGFNNGGIVRYDAGTAAIAGLTDAADYYIVNKAANTFQLALTSGGSAINLTSTGTGSQLFVPVMETRFSSNKYINNWAPQGVRLEPTGTSEILSTAHDKQITNVADTAHTATVGEGLIVYTTLTAARTVTLPDATLCKGKELVVKDGAGAAGTFNITLDGNGSQTIDGSSTVAISTNYGTKKVKSTGTAWITL